MREDATGPVRVRPAIMALLGCAAAGALVLGLGSRLVMRVIAVLAGPENQGAATLGGNVVGEITVKGTLGMIVPGTMGGIVSGVVYLLVRRWLPTGATARGAIFGLLTLLLFWSFLVGDGTDFRFAEPGVQLAMFAAVFLAYGPIASWWAERWGSGLPEPEPTRLGSLILSGGMMVGLAIQVSPSLEMILDYSVFGPLISAAGRHDQRSVGP